MKRVILTFGVIETLYPSAFLVPLVITSVQRGGDYEHT
jgi:hypothetical protein